MIHPLSWTLRSKSLFGRSKAIRRKTRRPWGDRGTPCLERVEERVLLCCTHNTAPEIASLEFVQVEDKTAYGQAPIGYLAGEVTDDTYHDNSQYEVRVDLDRDGNFDERAIFELDPELSTGDLGKFTFAYYLPGSLQENGNVAVQVAELARGDCPLLLSDSSGVAYTRTPPSNDAPEIKFTLVESGYGQPLTVWGEIRDYTPQGSYLIEIDGDRDGYIENTVSGADRGAFTITGYSAAGVTGRIRVTEQDMYGREYSTGWVDIGDAESANQAPTFSETGTYEDTIGYGALEHVENVATVTANDPDGDTLKYFLSESLFLLGFGSDGNFFHHVPRGLTIDENTGVVTVEGAGGLKDIRAFYERDSKHVFTVFADDGQTSTFVGFTLFDNWEYWISQAKAHISEWATAYGDAIVSSGSNAHDAIQKLDAFAGLDHIAGAVDAAVGLFWAAVPVNPAAAALGTAITTIVADAVAAVNEGKADDVNIEIQNLVDEVTQNSLDERTRVQKARNDKVIAKEDYLSGSTDSPDAKARQARELFEELLKELVLDPHGSVAVPSVNDIYGGLLYDYATDPAQGFDLQWLPQHDNGDGTCGLWVSDDWEILGQMDGTDVADELNAIGYNPDEV